MRLITKQSKRTKPNECGLPINNDSKVRLRTRNVLLTNEQRSTVKKMGIKPSKKMTEQQAANILKRIVTGETNYKIKGGVSLLTRKRITAKPKNVSKRQHQVSVYLHAIDNGSKRAEKELRKMK